MSDDLQPPKAKISVKNGRLTVELDGYLRYEGPRPDGDFTMELGEWDPVAFAAGVEAALGPKPKSAETVNAP